SRTPSSPKLTPRTPTPPQTRPPTPPTPRVTTRRETDEAPHHPPRERGTHRAGRAEPAGRVRHPGAVTGDAAGGTRDHAGPRRTAHRTDPHRSGRGDHGRRRGAGRRPARRPGDEPGVADPRRRVPARRGHRRR